MTMFFHMMSWLPCLSLINAFEGQWSITSPRPPAAGFQPQKHGPLPVEAYKDSRHSLRKWLPVKYLMTLSLVFFLVIANFWQAHKAVNGKHDGDAYRGLKSDWSLCFFKLITECTAPASDDTVHDTMMLISWLNTWSLLRWYGSRKCPFGFKVQQSMQPRGEESNGKETRLNSWRSDDTFKRGTKNPKSLFAEMYDANKG